MAIWSSKDVLGAFKRDEGQEEGLSSASHATKRGNKVTATL